MGTWKRALLAGVVLALCIGASLLWFDGDRKRTTRAPSPRDVSHAADRQDSDGPPAPTDSSRLDESLSPPVDLAKVDLDRDVHGIVVDREGSPIAGARLTVVRYPWQRASTLNVEQYFDEEVGASTRSAADGTFALRERRGRMVNLRAQAPGYAEVELRQLLAGERVRVVLGEAVSVLIRTVDEDANPVRDVKLRLRARSQRTGEQRHFERGLSSDADGLALVEDLPPRLKIWIRALGPESASPSSVYYETAKNGREELTIKLVAGRTITGRVVDASTNRPIAGARVGFSWTFERLARTDADGRYSIPGWQESVRGRIYVDAESYGQANTEVETRSVVNFSLRPGGGATGRALDDAGRPLAGVRIAALGVQEPLDKRISRRYARSLDDGSFELTGLRTDMVHTVVLYRTGFGRTIVELPPLDPTRGPHDLGEIRMPPARAIEGVLVDAMGEPVPRAEIRLVGLAPPHLRRPVTAGFADPPRFGDEERRVTDHLGRFRFPNLSAGNYALNVARPGRVHARMKIVLRPEEDLLDVEMRLADGRAFLVHVRDDRGEPVWGAVVHLRTDTGRLQNVTGDDGTAAFIVDGAIQQIEPPWLLPLRMREHGAVRPAYVRAKPIRFVPETESEAKFVLQSGKSARILVLGPDGKPMVGALVDVLVEGSPTRSIGVDAHGRVEIAVPPGGTVDVVLSGLKSRLGGYAKSTDGLEGELRGVRGGHEVIEMRVTRPSADRTLFVLVEGPDGEPIEGASVYVSPGPRTANSSGRTNAAGKIKLSDLLARAITVRVGHRRAQEWGLVPPAPLEVVPKGQPVVRRFEKGVPLEGVLLLPDGRPAPHGRLFVRVGKQILGQLVSDEEGRFTAYLPPKPTETIVIQGSLRQQDGSTLRTRNSEIHPDARSIRLRLRGGD
ncbi:MAG: carboxypeptidase regulatory-like domain-containing protein [Planctomycetota bacterium]